MNAVTADATPLRVTVEAPPIAPCASSASMRASLSRFAADSHARDRGRGERLDVRSVGVA